MQSWLFKWLYEAKDPAALGMARFFFGFIMIIDVFEERGLPYVIEKWGDPNSCYFPLFNNLPRLPIEYLYVVYLILLISAIGIMMGFFYRISCLMFILSYWYIFLLDKTVWNNHSYLYGLLSILFFITDAHSYWSVDSLLWPSLRNRSVPAWHYGIFKFQLFILYFFAGLKKLDRDWVDGYSMVGLSKKWIFDPFRMILSDEQIDYFMVHLCGLIFDLTAGLMLYFDKTRLIGFFFAYSFHGMNAVMFHIGMFSYVCMALIPIFCKPDWPKQCFKALPTILHHFTPLITDVQINPYCYYPENEGKMERKEKNRTDKRHRNEKQTLLSSIRYYGVVLTLISYCSIQMFLPWSHSLTKGYNSWTQGLYGYSWDMMVHSWQTQHVVVKLIDSKTKKKTYLRPGAFVPMGRRIFSHPDMMKQYAMCLAERAPLVEELEIDHAEVYLDVWKSLNERFQQRMIDPRVDLVTAEWHPFKDTPWLRPLLTELSPWRKTLAEIKALQNNTDIVFVADFPGLHLENYISEEIAGNITVLNGRVIVEQDSSNTSVSVNETLSLSSNASHRVYTVSDVPSCYMYVYYNTTEAGLSDEDIIKADPVLERKVQKLNEWNKMNIIQKAVQFYSDKFTMYRNSVWQIYFAVSTILDVGPGKDNGEYYGTDEL